MATEPKEDKLMSEEDSNTKKEARKDTFKIEMNKNTAWKIVAIILAGLAVFLWINRGGEQQPPVQQPPQQPSGPIEVSVDDDPFLGDADAPITIIEFSDFQCPFCGRFFAESEPLIIQNYVNTGKAKFVYRDFPLGFHPEATPAAEAAECANEQGKFWEFHNGLFENQASLSTALYQNLAEKYGLDVVQFEQCISTRKYQSEVQADFNYASSIGVSGTPTIFINGNKIVGAQPYQVFQQAIETELQG